MKLDKDLILKILERTEAHEPDPENKGRISIDFDGYNFEVVIYHLKRLSETPYVIFDKSINTEFPWPTSLSWQGHEYLDKLRETNSNTLWLVS